MRKFFTLLTCLLVTFSLFAQHDESARRGFNNQIRLTVSAANNNPVRVLIDGKNYNTMGYDNEMTITDIRPGYHSVKVYLQKTGRNGKGFNRGMQLVYDARVYFRQQYHTDISINRFGKAFIDEMQMNQAYYATYQEYDNDGGGWGNNDNYMQPMNSLTFDQFREILRNESFDDTRLVLAKQTIANNYFTSAQVKQLVQMFSFDKSRLDLAKYSYKYTTDKNNYFLLNDAFSFSSSKEDLARYVQSYR